MSVIAGHCRGARRSFLKKAGASIAAIALPASIFSSLFSPRTARADPVSTGLAVVSAVTSLFGLGSGSGKTMAAINLKLDQVLENQKAIIQGIEILQNSISQLPEKIAGLYTNENYRKAWEDADKVFDKIKDLCREDAPTDSRPQDHREAFHDLDDGIRTLKSRLATTVMTSEGVASALSAGKAMLLYALSLYAITNFEMNLPAEDRWRDGRAKKLIFMAEKMREAVGIFIFKRLGEAIDDQKRRQDAAIAEIQKTSWRGVFRSIARLTDKDTPTTSKAVCFESNEYEVFMKSRAMGYDPVPFLQTIEFTVYYEAHNVAWHEPEIFTLSQLKLSDKWLKRYWAKASDKTWKVTPNDDLHSWGVRSWQEYLDSPRRESRAYPSGQDGCFGTVPINEGVLAAEFASAASAAERAWQALSNDRILREIRRANGLLGRETANFVEQVKKNSGLAS